MKLTGGHIVEGADVARSLPAAMDAPAGVVRIGEPALERTGAVRSDPAPADPLEARRAAERLALAGDHEAAVTMLRGALASAEPELAIDLRLDMARSLGHVGRHGEAAEVLRTDREGPRAASRLALAEAMRLAGDLEGARAALERSRVIDGATGARERARQEAECALLGGDTTGAQRTAERLLGAAELAGAERMKLLDLLGRTFWASSAWAEASTRFAEARRGAAALGESRQEVRAAINEAVCRMKLGAADEAARGFRDATYLAAVLGLRREEAIATQNLAWLEHMRRRYGPALEHYRRALGLLDAVGNPEYFARHLHNLGELMLRLGDPVGAREQSESAAEVASRQTEVSPALRGEAALLRARIGLAAGRTEEAAAALDEARGIYASLAEPERLAEIAVLEADRLARDGRFAEGHDLVRGRTPLLSRFPKHHAEAMLVAADCLAARGSDPRASLERAIELARSLRDDELLWRAHLRLARHLHAVHRATEARRACAAARKADERIRETAPAEFLPRMERMPERAALRALVRQLDAVATCSIEAAPAGGVRPDPLVARSARFREVLDRARCVARGDASVLIVGETGSGKDRVARYVHEHSDRRGGPFVKVSCGAAVEDLFLTDLLGHERGAFTGAVERRAGWFETAAGGTLFLDEIVETSPRSQALILRVLEERRLVRVGGVEPVPVDVRVVCAANRPLEGLVEGGTFRGDLYYHLRAMRLEVPPLRERPEDVDGIADGVLGRVGGARGLRLTDGARAALRAHPWPGNARELENVVLAAAALAAGPDIDVGDLRLGDGPGRIAGPSALAREVGSALVGDLDAVLAGDRPLGEVLSALEDRMVAGALVRSEGNLAAAARMVGLPRARVAQAARRLGLRVARCSKEEVKP